MGVKAKRRVGFTLVEVIVAMTVFGMVIAGGLAGVSRGYELIGSSRNYTRVSQILQSEVEALRSLSWSELNKLPANELVEVSAQFDPSVYDRYTVLREIIAEGPRLSRVEITVTFVNDQGRTQEFTTLTFFTEGGANDYYYRTI